MSVTADTVELSDALGRRAAAIAGVETAPLIAQSRLDLDTVRDALLAEFGAGT